MNVKLNNNYGNLKESYLFSEIGAKVKAYKLAHPDNNVISLGIGDVTQPLTKSVIEAMHKAVDEMSCKQTFRGYAPEYGYDFLRQAIANHYSSFGVNLTADEIFVSDGAKSDLGNIVDILGDNDVYIPNPVYPVYVDSNIMSGRNTVFLNANKENGFLPMPPENNEKKGVFYLCSPNNPTGAVYNRSQLKEWISFAEKSGSLIIFDSAYEAFIQGDLPHSIYEIDGAKNCVIEICSLSKTAGFTGTRCAWTVVPENMVSEGKSLNKMWKRRQATKFNGVSYIVQRGAEAALSEKGLIECKELVAYYLENARLLSELLTEKGIWFTGGKNSPYLWLKCPNNMKSWEFFDYLLNNAEIVGTPGAGFGSEGEGYFRLTSFGDRLATEEAVKRLKNIL